MYVWLSVFNVTTELAVVSPAPQARFLDSSVQEEKKKKKKTRETNKCKCYKCKRGAAKRQTN